MLPEGWKVTTVGRALSIQNELRKPISAEIREKNAGPYAYYGPTKAQGFINTFEQDGRFCLIGEDGDHFLKFSTLPMTKIISGKCTVNNHAHILSNSSKCIIDWFFYYFMHRDISSHLTRQGAGRYKLTKKALEKLTILLPPLSEQKKIAVILSTWDRAIEGTEKLLANSQQQKKALMQQLLTGKKRLPGFTGEWLRYKLGEIADFLKGKGLSKADINPKGKTPCIHYGSLFTEQPSTITETKTLTNTFKGAVFSKKNDVLMPTSDVTPAGLAVASAIQKNNVLLGNDILIIRPNSERLYGPFLSRVIRNSKKNILSFATGTTVFHLYASDMKGFLLLVPPLPEQKAIAAVLTTADEEITTLQSDLSHLRQEKKALMQQLLTGKRRVTVD